jgi:hypothetical protein
MTRAGRDSEYPDPPRGLEVKIDQQTIGDLELFRSRNGTGGIFHLFDRTKTPGGSGALRFRFSQPMTDAVSIRRVQEGVRFLLAERVWFPLNPRDVQGVRLYLDSSWDVGSRAEGWQFFFDSLFVSIRYRDLFRFALRGVSQTRHLLTELSTFFKLIQAKAPPTELGGIVDEALTLISDLGLEGNGHLRQPWDVFRADRLFRILRKSDLRRILDLLSELDALISMAEVVEEHGLVFPEVVDSPEFLLEGEGVFHPILRNPVSNPVMVGGAKPVVFLTGPNMAGKTTYLKAVALSAFLAHLGMGVPAQRLRISVLDAIYSSLSPEENLRKGLSYFLAEVRRVREIAEGTAGGKKNLVLIDEVFRGTNVKDALDASRLVIRGFSRGLAGGFLFCSHLVELAEDLRGESRVGFACFEGQIQNRHASYDYVLREGVSRQRFGLRLLKEAGVPDLFHPDTAPPPFHDCPSCSETLPQHTEVRFCPFCGSNVQRVLCDSCGEKLRVIWRYCVACGTEVQPGHQSDVNGPRSLNREEEIDDPEVELPPVHDDPLTHLTH